MKPIAEDRGREHGLVDALMTAFSPRPSRANVPSTEAIAETAPARAGKR
jgi:hypothetical protein